MYGISKLRSFASDLWPGIEVGSEFKIDCSYLSPNVSIATSIERSTVRIAVGRMWDIFWASLGRKLGTYSEVQATRVPNAESESWCSKKKAVMEVCGSMVDGFSLSPDSSLCGQEVYNVSVIVAQSVRRSQMKQPRQQKSEMMGNYWTQWA